MKALVVFDTGRWLRIDDRRIDSRGEDVVDALPPREDERVVGVMAAHDVTVHRVMLPGLADAQARAAARVAIAEESMTPAAALHTATGAEASDGGRTVATAEAVRVTERLLDLARHGLDPDHLLAAPLLLPLPEEGFVSGDFGNGMMVRGLAAAFPDDPVLTPLLTDGIVPQRLDRDALEAAMIDAVANPEADLRQGVFAKRYRWNPDLARLRRLAMLVLVLGIVVLVTQLITVLRIDATAAAIETDSRARAASVLPPGTVITDPALQAEARLGAVGGAGGGFAPLAAAIVGAVDAVPGAELGSLIYDADGTLHALVRGGSVADLDAVQARLAATGVQVVAGPVVAAPSKPYRDLTVRAR